MTTRSAYSFSEFLDRNAIGRTKAYEEINSGRLKAKKLGNRTLITAEDEQAWVANLPSLVPNHSHAAPSQHAGSARTTTTVEEG